MQISFFEEFPTKENLEKIKLVDFPTKIYLGATSVKEFNKVKIKNTFVKENIYWPILDKKDGYWFSPFTNRKALDKTIKELKNTNIPIMWDAELPWHQNKALFLTQLPYFFSNRKKIRNFIKSRKEIYTAEYFPSSRLAEAFFRFVGVSFTSTNHYPIKMIYSSMHDFGETITRREVALAKKLFGDKLCLGYGTLTHGILGTEPVISPQLLRRDLKIAKDLGIKEVILFRLGGLNKKYVKVIKDFVT